MKKQAILIALIMLSSLSISAKDIVVINSENGKPLVGAKVFTNGDNIVSDRFGKLSNAEITSVDFVTYNNIHLNSTLQNDTLIVDFPLTLDSPKKMCRLEGKVTNDLNEELSYKEIELTKDGFSYTTKSNSSGDYSFDFLSTGDWDIVVEGSEDYKSYRHEMVINTEIRNNNIVLEGITELFGSISGVVIGKNGLPLSGASINLVNSKVIAKTNKNGQFEINYLKVGSYKLIMTTINFDTLDLEINVIIDFNSEAIFRLDSSIVYFSVPEIERTASGLVTQSTGVTNSNKNYNIIGTKSRSATPAGADFTGTYPDPLKFVNKFTGGFGSANNEVAEAGQLTSGEVNDFRKWDMWSDIAKDELSSYIDIWGIEPTSRYTIQLTSIDNRPVIDAKVNLINQVGKVIWSARSDNTGKAELWADAYSEIDDDISGLAVEVFYKGKRKYEQNISSFKDGINFIQVDEYCSQPNKVDILFAMDATGSMSDEIDYLRTELLDIIGKLEKSNNEIDLRIGSLFYRDYDYSFSELLTTHDLTNDISSVNEFINSEKAISGNSTPEAVDVALSSSVNEFTWSDDAIARIMFLILDAPPHRDAATMRRFTELTAKAAEMGIRIIPLTASGIDKSTEYLMRSLALLTNGTYVFLTDDSGIGNSHIEPTTDSYDVEMMNEMIVRIINQFIEVPACGENNNIDYAKSTEGKIYNDNIKVDNDISKYMKIYPNPTDGPLTLSLDEEYDNLFLVDMNGKILFKVEPTGNSFQISLANYPSGAYFLKYSKDGTWGSSQIQLMR